MIYSNPFSCYSNLQEITVYKCCSVVVNHYSKLSISVLIMQRITLLLGLGLIIIKLCTVNAQLRCDSFLRVVRPELFTHCSSCFYNSWSSWTRTGHPMSNSRCPTNNSFKEKEPEQIARVIVKWNQNRM